MMQGLQRLASLLALCLLLQEFHVTMQISPSGEIKDKVSVSSETQQDEQIDSVVIPAIVETAQRAISKRIDAEEWSKTKASIHCTKNIQVVDDVLDGLTMMPPSLRYTSAAAMYNVLGCHELAMRLGSLLVGASQRWPITTRMETEVCDEEAEQQFDTLMHADDSLGAVYDALAAGAYTALGCHQLGHKLAGKMITDFSLNEAEAGVALPDSTQMVVRRKRADCEADKTEADIYSVVEWIPFVGTLWDVGSTVAYAIEGCENLVKERGLSAAIGLALDGLTVATGGAAIGASTAGKTAVKAGLKAGAKAGAKAGIRTTLKNAARTGVKGLLKKFASEGSEVLAKKAAKKGLGEAAERGLKSGVKYADDLAAILRRAGSSAGDAASAAAKSATRTGSVGRILGSLDKLKPLVKLAGKGVTVASYIIDASQVAINFARVVTGECIHVYYPGICDKEAEIVTLAADLERMSAELNTSKIEVDELQQTLENYLVLLTVMNNNNGLIAQLYNSIVKQTEEIEVRKADIESVLGAEKADQITLASFDVAIGLAAIARTQVQGFIDEAGINAAIQGSLLGFTLVGIPLMQSGFTRLKAHYEIKKLASGPKGRARAGAISNVDVPARLGRRLRVKGRILSAGKKLLSGVAFALPAAAAGLVLGLSIKAEADVSKYLTETLEELRIAKADAQDRLAKAAQTQINQQLQWEAFGTFFVQMTSTFENGSAPLMSTMCEACGDCPDIVDTMCTQGCASDVACADSCRATKSDVICTTCSDVQTLFFCTPLGDLVGEGLTADNLNLLIEVQEKAIALLSSQNRTLTTVRTYLDDQWAAIQFVVNSAGTTPPKPLATIAQDLELQGFPEFAKNQILDIIARAQPTWTSYDGCSLATRACWQDTARQLLADSTPLDAITAQVRLVDGSVTREAVLGFIRESRPQLTAYDGCLVQPPYTCARDKIREWVDANRSVEFMLEILETLQLTLDERQILQIIANLRPGAAAYRSCNLRTFMCP